MEPCAWREVDPRLANGAVLGHYRQEHFRQKGFEER